MDSTSSTTIVISRPETVWMGSARSFVVSIDGRKAGSVKRGAPSQFAVSPGTHEVAVSIDWVRSRAVQVVAETGSKTELAIGFGSGMWFKLFLPILICVVVAQLAIGELITARPLGEHGWIRMGIFFAVYATLFVGYIVATSVLVRDYWNLLTLEPAGTVAPKAVERD